MFDDLKLYLLNMRIRLEKANKGNEGIPLDIFMEEITQMAVVNWRDREDNVPDLTSEQINKAVIRVLTRTYNKN
jgi:hypothetical protein